MPVKFLLHCGWISSIIYLIMNIVCPILNPHYDVFSQTVSELSAINAPTRSTWILFAIVYDALVILFALGIRQSANGNRALLVSALLFLLYGILGPVWPPMHQREVLAAGGKTSMDTWHIVFTIVTVLLMMLAMGFGAAALGKKFRTYSIQTILIQIIFGILTSRFAPAIEANHPTPWAGVWERVNIGAFILWVSIFSFVLLKRSARSSMSELID